MEPIASKYRVLSECESTSFELRANELRVYPIASCKPMNLQVIKLTVARLRASLITFKLVF